MKKINLKAVILAMLLVVALDVVIAIVLMAVLGPTHAKEGMASKETSDTVVAISRSATFLLASLVLGLLSTAVGGYIAARIAKKDQYLNASIIGLLGILLGVFTAGNYPLWFDVAAFLSTLPAALLGGHFAKRGIML